MVNQPQSWQYPPMPPPYQPGPLASPAPPGAVKKAVGFMCAGAAFSVVSGVASIVGVNGFFNEQSAGVPLDEGLLIGVNLSWGLAGAALWLWMAWKVRAGRNWARAMSAALFILLGMACALATFGALWDLAGGGSRAETALFLATLVIPWMVGLIVIILLWQPQSNLFFAAARQARSAPASGYGPPLQDPGPRPPQ